MIDGYKTYIVGLGMVAYAIIGALLEYHTWNDAAELIFQALGLMGLRHGVSKAVKK